MNEQPTSAVSTAIVVIPTYNERHNIGRLTDVIRQIGCRVLVVDDGSPDGTGDVVDELAAADDGVSILHRTEKAGIGPAYAAGFGVALATDAETICQMDADFSHDPQDLPRLIEGVAAGADLAIGSRYVPVVVHPTGRSCVGSFPAVETSMRGHCSE